MKPSSVLWAASSLWGFCLLCLRSMGLVGGGLTVRLAGGRLPTACLLGNLSSSGILSGLAFKVQLSSVGKYVRAFSGCISSKCALFLRNSGQVRSQLECSSDLQATQCLLFGSSQSRVACSPPHVPHVFVVARHSDVKCPHLRHFMHCFGSYFSLLGNTLVLHMYIPSLISRLASEAEESEMVA